MLPVLAQSAERLTEVCGPPDESSYVCRRVFEWTGNELLAKATDFLVARPLRILVILVAAWLVLRLARRAIRRFVARARDEAPPSDGAGLGTRRRQRAEAIGAVLRSVATFAVSTLALLMVLGEVGVNLGPLIAGAGIAGVALGFGAQTLVRDFLSGIFMIIEDQYGVGDVVEVEGITGKVEGLTLRATRIRSQDGTLWHVPNGAIAKVGNKSQQWTRALVDMEIAHASDIRRAMDVMKTAADALHADETWGPEILEEPEVWGVESLGATAIVIRVAAKTRPGKHPDVERELRHRLTEAFHEAGIPIPQPQRMLMVPPAEEPAPEP